MKRITLNLFFAISAFLILTPCGASSFGEQQRKMSRIERRADKNYVGQRFDKAMAGYEKAINREKNMESRAALNIKTASLYFMIRNYPKAAEHFGSAMQLAPYLFDVHNICDYIDALRFCGEKQKAEAICLDNAYRDQYSRYQRYLNTLEALSMQYILREDPDYQVKRLDLNTKNAEFWLGKFDDELFYAVSYSRFNDPGKLFFHRTHYYPIASEAFEIAGKQKPAAYSKWFRKIPADLQNGPVSFTPDMRMMVATAVQYAKTKASVEMADKDLRPFRTKLLYSVLKDGKRKYSRYSPVFPQDEQYSYAHPYIFNNGKSMLFTSDMPGGYGGFDLYVTHWNEFIQAWSEPENLGPHVNTEGDEIFPVVDNGILIFSSNGLPGFGGYDLFSVPFDNEGIAPGSVKHFPYPVNSEFNDYYMLPVDTQNAYFISDRDIKNGDDIYFLHTIAELGKTEVKPFFGMSEDKAVLGGELLLNGFPETAMPQTVSLKDFAPEGLLLSVYFDFDSDQLTPESMQLLDRLAKDLEGYNIFKLQYDGFADEFGSEQYNLDLSARRANNVSNYLKMKGVDASLEIRAFGKTWLSPNTIEEEIRLYSWPEGYIDWIQVNRRARRVDIYNLK